MALFHSISYKVEVVKAFSLTVDTKTCKKIKYNRLFSKYVKEKLN